MAEAEHSWKTIAYRAFVVIFVLGLITSTTAIWANVRVQESDAWARTMAPLADDTVVQEFVAEQASLLIDRQIAADEDAGLLQSFSRSQLSGLVRMGLNDFVASSTFSAWWTEANRAAHGVTMHAIHDDQGTFLQTQGNNLVLELQPAVDWVNGHLQALLPSVGYTISLPPERAVIVLYSSDTLETIANVIDLLDTLAIVLPIITLISLAGVLILARDRVDALRHLGLASAIGIMVLLVVTGIGRTWFVSRQETSHQDLLDAIIRIVLVDLMRALRLLALGGLVISGMVYVLRSTYANDPRVRAFLRKHRELIAGTTLGAAAVMLILGNYPPVWQSVLLLTVVLVCGTFLFRWRKQAVYPVIEDAKAADT